MKSVHAAPYPVGVDYQNQPIDETSRTRLQESGLDLKRIDTDHAESFDRWLQVEARGFHQGQLSPEELADLREALAYRRTTAVTDADAVVATVNAWPVELTVPGDCSVGVWAISGVTVAATHRRRGIARALLESELRTAAALGLPLAILTVSEATIYGRFGFAPTVRSVDLTIDTRRAKWTGPDVSGSVRFVDAADLLPDADAILERVRLMHPGMVSIWKHFTARALATSPGSAERGKNLRYVRYADLDGNAQGFAVFRLTHSDDDFSAGVLDIEMLIAATDDAYAALWRFMLDMDLVSTVKAPLRSVDEPVLWQVSDSRAVRSSAVRDHLWARILDVRSALEARRFRGPAMFILDVTDDLGFANGRHLVTIDDLGRARVGSGVKVDAAGATQERPEISGHVELGVNELGALYLGGVSAAMLASAGRLVERSAGSARALDRAFRADVAPWLGFWF